LSKADEPLLIEKQILENEDFYVKYCEKNLKMRIAKLKITADNIISANSQNSMASGGTDKNNQMRSANSSSSDNPNDMGDLEKQNFWGDLSFDSEDRLDTSFSTYKEKSEDSADNVSSSEDPNLDPNVPLPANILGGTAGAPKEKKKKAKKQKKKKFLEKSRKKILGVESNIRLKSMDQFGHLDDSGLDLNDGGLDDIVNHMKKMGIKISYQRDKDGLNLKSALRPRHGKKKKNLKVNFDFQGIDIVRDENTRVKLKESNDDFIADKVVKKSVSLSESTMADSQFMEERTTTLRRKERKDTKGPLVKKKKLKDNVLDEDPELRNIDSIDKMKALVSKTYSSLKKPTEISKAKVDEKGTKPSEFKLTAASRRPTLNSTETNDKSKKISVKSRTAAEDHVDYDSDEEIKNLRVIAKKKDTVYKKELNQNMDLISQQKLASDYKRDLDKKKDFFVEIVPKYEDDEFFPTGKGINLASLFEPKKY
jgi:hypothetical protein